VQSGQIPMDFATYLSREQEMRRVMIRGLKTCTVSRSEFRKRFGIDVELVFGSEIDALVSEQLLRYEDDDIVLTRSGQLYSTNVYERFFTEDDLAPPAPGEVRFGISELVE